MRETNGRNGTLPPETIRRLEEVGLRVPPPQIADVWIFPPLDGVDGSSEFLLFTRLMEGQERRLYTARRAAHPNGSSQEIEEHGRVPAGRMPRLIEHFRRRLGEETEPLHLEVHGSEARWRELLALEEELAGPPDLPTDRPGVAA